MLELFKNKEEKEKSMSILKNPFDKNSVTDIDMYITKDLFGKDKPKIYANISFQNGGTSGKQRIDAESLPDLLNKIDEFLKSI